MSFFSKNIFPLYCRPPSAAPFPKASAKVGTLFVSTKSFKNFFYSKKLHFHSLNLTVCELRTKIFLLFFICNFTFINQAFLYFAFTAFFTIFAHYYISTKFLFIHEIFISYIYYRHDSFSVKCVKFRQCKISQ